MSERQLSEAPLRVCSELREARLASPLRRFLALILDLLLLVPPSFAVAGGAALLSLRLQDPAAFRALPVVFAHEPGRPAPAAALAAIAPVLVEQDAEGLPPEVAVAVHHGDGARAAALLRDYDFLARYAGDEFVAIIPETDELDIHDLCKRIEDSIRKFTLPVGKNETTQVGVSIGTADFPNKGESLDQIIIAADKAMYSVKDIHKRRRVLIEKQTIEINKLKAESFLQKVNRKPETITFENPRLDNDFIVELDESHIISSAVN